MKNIEGKMLFLNQDDIDTDAIIPAKYLSEGEKEGLKPYLFEDLEGFDVKDIDGKSIIVARKNFGCGSSREHAVWALEQNGIYAVVAESFGRIFKTNMFNDAFPAIELPKEDIDKLFGYKNKDIIAKISIDNSLIQITEKNKIENFKFSISDFHRALINEGGWVNYADKRY